MKEWVSQLYKEAVSMLDCSEKRHLPRETENLNILPECSNTNVT